MAENKGIVHLTTIQFDTSSIGGQLQSMQQQLATAVQQIQTDERYKIKLNVAPVDTTAITKGLQSSLSGTNKALKETSSLTDEVARKMASSAKISTTEFARYESQLRTIIAQQGELSKFDISRTFKTVTDEDGTKKQVENLRASVEYINQYGVRLREAYSLIQNNETKTREWALSNQTLSENLKTAATEQNKIYKEQEKSIKAVATQLKSVYSQLTSTSNVPTDSIKKAQTEFSKLANIQAQFAKTGAITTISQGELGNIQKSIDLFNKELIVIKARNAEIKKQTQQATEQKKVTDEYNKTITSIDKLSLSFANLASKMSTTTNVPTALFDKYKAEYNTLIRLQTEFAKSQKLSDASKTQLIATQNSIKAINQEIVAIDSKNKKLASQEKQLATLIAKQEQQTRLLQQQPTFTDQSQIFQQLQANLTETNRLMTQVQSGQLITTDQAKQISQLSAETRSFTSDIQKRIAQERLLTTTIKEQQAQLAKATSLPSIQQNANAIAQMQTNLNNLLGLQTALSNQRVFTPQQQTDLQNYASEVRRLSTDMQSTTASSNNLLRTITDKARWMAAFYLIMYIRRGFRDLITTIKETEMSVVELQRVLSEDVGTVTIQQNLYGLTSEYGRAIDEVSETAVKFAQTGASWNETLKLTEATLLAVNTAELQVETATTGLIAVLSQFNIDAEDMVGVIDKINITADNFAVTSEKIVAALQRAGGAAMAANLSLEDTIAVITSLSEATGRSGENIGTALNSLISYTQKAGSLDFFSSQSEQMDKLVRMYRSGAIDIVALWQGLSTEINRLSEEQQIALSKIMEQDVSYQEFASDLEAEATDITQSLNGIYDTAGIYRRNYFIALLDNMDTYMGAMENMVDAEGYSLAENEKYMSTLTAQYQQLIAETKELGVAFGEAGFLDFLKGLVQLGIGTVNATESIGGLINVFRLLAVVLAVIKMEKLVASFSSLTFTTNGTISNMALVVNRLRGVQTQATATATSIQLLSGALSIATIALGAITWAVSLYNQEQEKAKQNAIDTARNSVEYANSLETLKQKYIEITESTEQEALKNEQLAQWKKELVDLYGIEAEKLAEVNLQRETGIALINEEMQVDYINWLNENIEQLDKAREVMEEPIRPTITFDTDTKSEVLDLLRDFENIIPDVNYSLGAETSVDLIIQGKTLQEQYNNVNQVIYELRENSSKYGEEGEIVLGKLTSIAERLKNQIEEYGEVYSSANEKQETYFKSLYQEQLNVAKETGNIIAQTMAYLNVIREVSQEQGMSQEVKDTIKEWAKFVFVKDTIEETIASLDEMSAISLKISDNLEAYKDQLEGFETLYDGLEEYNTEGEIAFDTLQDLIAVTQEYGLALSFQNGQLVAVDETTGQLIISREELTKKILQEQLASQLLAVTQKYQAEMTAKVAEEAENAETKVGEFESTLGALAETAINTTEDLNPLVANLVNLFNVAEGGDVDEGLLDRLNADLLEVAQTHRTLADNVYTSTSSTSAYEKAIDKLQKQFDALISVEQQRLSLAEAMGKSEEEQIKHLKNLQQLAHEYANALRDIGYDESSLEILEQQTEWQELQADIVGLIQSKNEDLIAVEQQRLTLTETMGKSEEEQIAHLKELQRLTHEYANELRDLGYAEGSMEILELQTQWQQYQQEIMNMLADQAEAQNQLIIDRWELELDYLDDQIEYVENKYNAEIDGLKAVEAENDRIRAKEEYYENLASAKSDLASAEARSGVEYREAEFEAQKEIDSLNKDWQEQLEEWQIEDTITKIETLRDAEVEALYKQKEAIQSTIERLSEDLAKAVENGNQEALERMATDSQAILLAKQGELVVLSEEWAQQQALMSETTNAENLQSFQSDFVNPMVQLWGTAVTENAQMQNLSMEEVANNSLSIYRNNFLIPLRLDIQTTFDYMLAAANNNSLVMYELYKNNFLNKMKSDIDGMFTSISSEDAKNQSSTSNYNTSTKNNNMQMYVNMQPQSTARTLSDIFSRFW